MKRLFVMLTFCMGITSLVHGQTWEEWFRQKKTQKKYLLEQIAALKVYIDYARKGYKIASDGLGLIRKIKKGDLNLHAGYFASLNAVNPRIKNYSKVAAAIALQISIVKQLQQSLSGIRTSGQFTADEIGYSEKVIERLLTDCLDSINELYLVITADQLALKDDERIKRIDQLYADMQNKHAFISSFSEEVGVLAMQRKIEGIEVNYSKIINQLP
jgi:hypothetical protein